MMSRKNFVIVLLVFCLYVLLGAMIFHGIELPEEMKRIDQEISERKQVIDIVRKYNSIAGERGELFDALEEYCGKPIKNVTTIVKPKWDFYHSLFFVITVVSTIGYGNLAPTTMFGRIFMIFYALVGIPINGFIMVALGDFFGRSFTKLYNRWKDSKRITQVDPSRLGLVAQIILYLVPGFTFFIFVPSIVISAFEGWHYDEAVYFSFVTLTTIGFGDYVAGDGQADFGYFYHSFYQIFLLVWVIGGLGYVVMILNFIAKGMRSKKLQELEHRIANNILKTPTKIRHELRSILEEFLMNRVKKVYKEFDYKPKTIERSQSCPDLNIYRTPSFPNNLDRKRAFSECQENFILQRIQSDTDLERIDKDLTFQGTKEHADLIIKVVDALTGTDYTKPEPGCYQGLSEKEILASEQYDSAWSLASQRVAQPLPPFRTRAASDVKYPSHPRLASNENTWYGQTPLAKYAKLIKDDKSTSQPVDVPKETPGFFKRIKNTLLLNKDKSSDVERGGDDPQTTQPQNREQILESTSVADLIRALSVLTEQTDQLGTTRTRRMPIKTNFTNRRSSLMTYAPTEPHPPKPIRRSSLMPAADLLRFSTSSTATYGSAGVGARRRSLTPVSELPPPYHQIVQDGGFPVNPSKIRRFSVRPVPTNKDADDSSNTK